MQLKNTLPMLMLAALASLAAVPVVHAFGGVIADEASSHTRALLSHTDGELASPYTTADAVVLGEAGPEVQAAFAAELGGLTALRHLLHGPHSGSASRRLPTCNKCRIVSCKGKACTGHCKSGKRIHICHAGSRSPPSPPKSPPKKKASSRASSRVSGRGRRKAKASSSASASASASSK